MSGRSRHWTDRPVRAGPVQCLERLKVWVLDKMVAVSVPYTRGTARVLNRLIINQKEAKRSIRLDGQEEI